MVFHWNLSDSKSLLVSRTLISIPTNVNNAAVWMVSTCPLISKSSYPFTKTLGIVPSGPITIGITVCVVQVDLLSLKKSLKLGVDLYTRAKI